LQWTSVVYHKLYQHWSYHSLYSRYHFVDTIENPKFLGFKLEIEESTTMQRTSRILVKTVKELGEETKTYDGVKSKRKSN